jgi:hypothetical protein
MTMTAPPQPPSGPSSPATSTSSAFPSLNLTHQDLLNTANELYRRMEDPGFAQDDAYWTSLPIHLRNFIRNALPLAGNVSAGSGVLPGGVHAAGGQRAMYALAQQIVSAANTGMGAGQPSSASAVMQQGGVVGVGAGQMSLDDLATMPPEAMLAYQPQQATGGDPRQYGFYTHPDHARMPGGMPQADEYLQDDE